MNFLSHFYFDRASNNPDRTIGMVLPDLVKNACKDWSLRPEKKQDLFTGDEKLFNILEGWKRHLTVDRCFHSSNFFCSHTSNIKRRILPVLANSVARPSFVAHISLELMLDSLLLTEDIVQTEGFYKALSDADRPALTEFLRLNDVTDASLFFRFLDSFIDSAYLNDYRNTSHIIYALGRICMRLWSDPFTDAQKLELTEILLGYMELLKDDYMTIFEEIEEKLIPYT